MLTVASRMKICASKWRRIYAFLTLLCISGLYIYILIEKSFVSMISSNQEVNKVVYGVSEAGDVERTIIKDIENRIADPVGGRKLNRWPADSTKVDSSRGRFAIVDKYLQHRENGYFLEIGTDISDSFTQMMEEVRGWTGLLIEPSQARYNATRSKPRNSQILHACIKNSSSSWPHLEANNAPCFHTKHIIKALHRSVIDLLVLNVEDGELFILQNFPFGEIDVAIVTIEIESVTVNVWPLVNFLRSQGYKTVQIMTNHVFKKTDVISVKDGLEA